MSNLRLIVLAVLRAAGSGVFAGPLCRSSSWPAASVAKVLPVLLAVSLAAPAPAGVHYQRLKSFGFRNLSGQNPEAPLIQGSDGALYGTTLVGGSNDAGTVFTLNKDGSGFRVLHSFAGSGGDGQHPFAGLIEGSDGAMYGTTVGGGSNGVGTAFTLNRDGSCYGVLFSFRPDGSDGQNPSAGLLEGSDGTLYGTTYNGGSNGVGTVFKLNKDGRAYTAVLSFGGLGSDGANSSAGLVEGRDWARYGTTVGG